MKVQKHLQAQGIICHTGSGFIGWHDDFRNLVVFDDDGRGFRYYQKVDFFHPDYGYNVCKSESL